MKKEFNEFEEPCEYDDSDDITDDFDSQHAFS